MRLDSFFFFRKLVSIGICVGFCYGLSLQIGSVKCHYYLHRGIGPFTYGHMLHVSNYSSCVPL
jgi:hypothetical protein